METLQRHLGMAISGAQVPVAGNNGELPAHVSDRMPTPAVPGTLRSEFSADPDMSEILSDFTGGLPDQVAQISQLLEQGNLDELKRSVHRIKGAGGGYGFPQITDAAAHAERQIAAATAVEAVQADVRSLLNLIRSVEGYDTGKEDLHVAKSSSH